LSLCLLHLFVRIQLNILGRLVYLDTAMEKAGQNEPQRVSFNFLFLTVILYYVIVSWNLIIIFLCVVSSIQNPLTMSCQHKFIAFADYLPHWGLESLIDDVYVSVCNVLKE
jgi:Peroxin-3